MKKIKTNLPGLDPLLHGGLQIDSLTGSGSPSDSLSSIVIVLRGKKGVSKHLFALQLMHGIARSLRKSHPEKEPTTYYYSINKNTDKLNDAYIDYLIADWLLFMTRQSRLDKLGFRLAEANNKVVDEKQLIYELLFDSKLENKDAYVALKAHRRSMVQRYGNQIVDFISDNILTYNPRTNSLHFRRPYMGDGPKNLWAVRNKDTIGEYFDQFDKKLGSLKDSDGSIATYFKEIFINVVFNGHLNKDKKSGIDSQYGDIGNMEKYSKTAHVIYDDILDHMESVLNGENSKDKWSIFESSCDDSDVTTENDKTEDKHVPMHDVLVIDGFSQFDDEHLKSLQFSHLHKVARRMARVTILVLDEREEALCDGDIIINLKKTEDAKQEYTYHELQIVKSSFQEVANGWHQYKVQPDGIKVFPSIHFLLSKRYYLKSRTHEIGQGILEDSFEEYLDSMLHMANSNPCVQLNVEGFLYNQYSDKKEAHHRDRFMRILENHRKWNSMTGTTEAGVPDAGEGTELIRRKLVKVMIGEDFFSGCQRKQCGTIPVSDDCPGLCKICGNPDDDPGSPWKPEKPTENGVKPETEICGWDKRYPTTVIVGNPNSFKRRIALGKAYHWARRKEHVLIVLFGKNDDMLRKQLICPALQRAACAKKVFNKKDEYGRNLEGESIKIAEQMAEERFGDEIYPICSECEKYIHFFRIRMGCITAEEIFFRLEEQIRIYSNEDPETGIEKSRLHIVIDDLQRVDFGFPFLRDTSLFTGALINLCHEHKAELTILCDKHSTRTKEVCALSDNVIVMDRKKDNINKVRLYVERCVDFPAPGAIIDVEICDVLNLFQCSCIGNTYITPNHPNSDKTTKSIPAGLSIDFSRLGSLRLIGSMREFWRDTINEVVKQDPGDKKSNSAGTYPQSEKE